MNYCSYCLLSYPAQGVFCQQCGTPLALLGKEPVSGNSPDSVSSSALLSRWIALGVALICLVLQAIFRTDIFANALSIVVLAGCGIMVGRPRGISRMLERCGLWLERQMEKAGQGGKFSRWIVKPSYGMCHLATGVTRRIPDPFVRNGLRLSLWIIAGGIGIFLTLAAVFAVVYVVLVIATIIFMLWLLGKILGEYLGGGSGPSGQIRHTVDWLGKPKEEVYEDGKKVGELRPTQDWLGQPKKDVYRDGRKVGEVRPSTDFLGNPRKEIIEDGKKVGELRPTTDFLGNPKEEVYKDGKKVGEQVPGTDLLGNPTKDLYGSGHPGTKKEPEESD